MYLRGHFLSSATPAPCPISPPWVEISLLSPSLRPIWVTSYSLCGCNSMSMSSDYPQRLKFPSACSTLSSPLHTECFIWHVLVRLRWVDIVSFIFYSVRPLVKILLWKQFRTDQIEKKNLRNNNCYTLSFMLHFNCNSYILSPFCTHLMDHSNFHSTRESIQMGVS